MDEAPAFCANNIRFGISVHVAELSVCENDLPFLVNVNAGEGVFEDLRVLVFTDPARVFSGLKPLVHIFQFLQTRFELTGGLFLRHPATSPAYRFMLFRIRSKSASGIWIMFKVCRKPHWPDGRGRANRRSRIMDPAPRLDQNLADAVIRPTESVLQLPVELCPFPAAMHVFVRAGRAHKRSGVSGVVRG
jgi:hypothetical protein